MQVDFLVAPAACCEAFFGWEAGRADKIEPQRLFCNNKALPDSNLGRIKDPLFYSFAKGMADFSPSLSWGVQLGIPKPLGVNSLEARHLQPSGSLCNRWRHSLLLCCFPRDIIICPFFPLPPNETGGLWAVAGWLAMFAQACRAWESGDFFLFFFPYCCKLLIAGPPQPQSMALHCAVDFLNPRYHCRRKIPSLYHSRNGFDLSLTSGPVSLCCSKGFPDFVASFPRSGQQLAP